MIINLNTYASHSLCTTRVYEMPGEKLISYLLAMVSSLEGYAIYLRRGHYYS
jgi:hypothetical protein